MKLEEAHRRLVKKLEQLGRDNEREVRTLKNDIAAAKSRIESLEEQVNLPLLSFAAFGIMTLFHKQYRANKFVSGITNPLVNICGTRLILIFIEWKALGT